MCLGIFGGSSSSTQERVRRLRFHAKGGYRPHVCVLLPGCYTETCSWRAGLALALQTDPNSTRSLPILRTSAYPLSSLSYAYRAAR